MADWAGLENQWAGNRPVSSNLTLSASNFYLEADCRAFLMITATATSTATNN